MSNHNTPGRIDNLGPSKVLLYNFRIDGFDLKPQHREYLSSVVVPKLNVGGNISIVGLASRTGSVGHNDRLSEARAYSVLDFLQKRVPKGFPVREFKAFGQHKAEQEHARQGAEDERFRSVVLFLGTGPKPPTPTIDPGSVISELPTFVTYSGALDTIGQVLDVLSGAGSLVTLFVEAVAIDVAGAALTAISALISLPAVWISGQKAAEKNGGMLGYSKAMQKLADAFSNFDLKDVPESSWPAIPHPVPTFTPPDDAVTVAERSARHGHRKGYEDAYAFIRKLDAEPREFVANHKGKQAKIKLTGRRLLWFLSQAYHEDVWRRIHAMLEYKAK